MDHWISATTLSMQKKHAKDCTVIIQQLLDAETRQFLHSNKSDQGPTSSSKATKNIRVDLVHHDGNIMFPRQCIRLHLRHHGGNRATAAGHRETGTLHHGRNCDLLSFQMRHFAFRKFSLLAIDGCVISTPTGHTFHAHIVSVLVPACCHSCSSGYSHLVTH